MATSPEYYKSWYEKNKEKRNSARREQYQADPAYRAAVRKRNKRWRQRKAAESMVETAARRDAKKVRGQGARPLVIQLEIDGQVVAAPVFSIGVLAKVTRRSVFTLRLWEREGVIPATPLRTAKGDRYYTIEWLEMIRALLVAKGKINDSTSLIAAQARKTRVYERTVRKADGSVKTMPLFRVGVLAKAIGRSVVSVEEMESRGALPETPLRASKLKYRLYSVDMIEVVEKALKECDERWGHGYGDRLRAAVEKGWRKIGMMDATLVEDAHD